MSLLLGEEIVGLRARPRVLDLGAIQEEGISLVEEEDALGSFGLPEGLGDSLLGIADPNTEEVE